MAKMERIVWHWTAGGHRANATDRRHYNYIVEGDGRVVEGDHSVADQADVTDGIYGRHTRRLNTGSIGVAVAAMAGARERPFDPGRYPITEAQVDALARLTADLCRRHDIPLGRRTVLSHAEVPGTLGVAQPGKWDITWLPGMHQTGDPQSVGDTLRARVREARITVRPGALPAETGSKGRQGSLVAAVVAIVAALVVFVIGGK